MVLPLLFGFSTNQGKLNGHDVVITTTPRTAGAIHSLVWKGKEFVNSTDHGRQIQSASNFDNGTKLSAETYNPTEAGSRRDGAGLKSSSKLLEITAKDNVLSTKSNMAFWLAPGEKSGPNLAKNKTILSGHLLEKKVTIKADLIDYVVTFTLPKGEKHNHAVFESLTGYMPAEFSVFWRFDRTKQKLVPLSDGPGESADPVVLSTPDGQFAMGAYSRYLPVPGFENLGYGRWRFGPEKVVKWNCVFRVNNPTPGATYTYQHSLLVGDLRQVEATLIRLTGPQSSRKGWGGNETTPTPCALH